MTQRLSEIAYFAETWWPRTVYRTEYAETQCKKAAGRLLDGRTWDEVPNV